MSEEELKLSGSLSVAMKVNLGNYESADAFISISSITENTTEEQINQLLDGNMRITYNALRERLKERIIKLRTEKEF